MPTILLQNDRQTEIVLESLADRLPFKPSKTRLADAIVRRAICMPDSELMNWLEITDTQPSAPGEGKQ